MAYSVDPDQNALLGAVLSGSTLFAQTCLSKNLGSLYEPQHEKTCLCHTPTTKAQISLCIRAV